MRSLLTATIVGLGMALASCEPATELSAWEWVGFSPVQCESNPWSSDDLDAVVDSFARSGVEIREVGLVQVAEAVCTACGCPSGRMIVARVSPADALRLVGEFGFAFLFSAGRSPWMTFSPIQCGGNPWEPYPEDLDEAQAVRAWAAGEGATIRLAGFVHQTEPFAVCLACICPRGDRLLVSAGSASDARILAGFGFAPLFPEGSRAHRARARRAGR